MNKLIAFLYVFSLIFQPLSADIYDKCYFLDQKTLNDKTIIYEKDNFNFEVKFDALFQGQWQQSISFPDFKSLQKSYPSIITGLNLRPSKDGIIFIKTVFPFNSKPIDFYDNAGTITIHEQRTTQTGRSERLF